MTYISGDFYRICEVCGFRYRASKTERRWDGLIVCHEDWESRHPQDFVRGRKDLQNVPNPRPESITALVGTLQTSLTQDVGASDTTLHVESSVRFELDDEIGVTSASGDVLRRVVGSVPTTTSIIITAPLAASASSGALVVNYSAVAEVDIG